MPELPEVETMVRGIQPAVEGRIVEAMTKCRCSCRPILVRPGWRRFVQRVRGSRVERVERLAKRVVLCLSTADRLVIEPRMTGLMLLSDPPDREHLRICWKLADSGGSNALWFWDRRGLGTVQLYSAHEFEADLCSGHLGPDALAITPADLKHRCNGSRRPIKSLLLDQRTIAGIGNLYASEILHVAGISPKTRSDSLSTTRVRRLHATIYDILEQAIRYEGSTLGDGTWRNALNKSGRYQNEHRVYAREGKVCRTCRRGRIRRIIQTQRSTFYCPVCQR